MSSRILIITGIYPPDIGGPASYARALAGHLSQNGKKIAVVTYSRRWKADVVNGYPVVRVWKRWPWPIRHALFFIKSFSLAKSADTLYVLNTINGGLTALGIKKLLHKKVIIRIAGDYAWQIAVEKGKTNILIDDFQKAPKTGWISILWRLQSFVCQHADQIVVPSEYLAGLVRGWGVSEDKIKVIYNGVDFKPSELSKEDARRKVGISGNIILSAGRLVPWKGFRMLIKIMPQLLAVNQFFRLVIVGEGPDKNRLQAMIKNLNIDRQVVITGAQTPDKLATFVAAADVFVLNTGYEGFSHQILEVMLAGVPIITTPVGGNLEVMKQGENGLMIRYNDEQNLVEAIKTLWNHAELREQFAVAAKQTAVTFNAERMLKNTSDLLAL